MKIVILLIPGCLLAGCADYQSVDNQHQTSQNCEALAETTCELALCKYNRWADEICRDWDSCCFCHCWNNGRQIPEFPDECNCIEPEMPPDEYGECQGDILRDSEQCLQDEDTCQEWLEETVIQLCDLWFP